MKNQCIVAILLVLGQCAFAQDGSAAALGAGAEMNMNAHKYFAGGAVLGLDFTLPHSFAIGVLGTASFNTALTAIEAAAMLRRYFGSKGFFMQADAGALFYMEDMYRDGTIRAMFSGGLRTGFRLPYSAQAWYIEPYARGGYPFIFSVGVVAGVRFFHKEQAQEQELEGAGINR